MLFDQATNRYTRIHNKYIREFIVSVGAIQMPQYVS